MRIWSVLAQPLLTLPLLAACAVSGPVGSPTGGGTTVLGSSAEGTPGTVTPMPPVNDSLGHQSFSILINDTRGGFDVLPVVENDLLNEAASLHAQDMVENDYLSHTGLDGSTVGDRVLEVGYDYSFVAENIAQGFTTETAVMDAWMDSPGHRDNILDPRAVDFGIAQEDTTWVLLLGSQ